MARCLSASRGLHAVADGSRSLADDWPAPGQVSGELSAGGILTCYCSGPAIATTTPAIGLVAGNGQKRAQLRPKEAVRILLQVESEELLLQTAEGQDLGLSVERIEDIRPWISAAVQEEETLSCGQLNTIAHLLQVHSHVNWAGPPSAGVAFLQKASQCTNCHPVQPVF